MRDSSHVTRLLARAREGQNVIDELMPLIYDDLRSLAEVYMRSERRGHTLQPTALVNEAYVRLVSGARTSWKDRAHFFAAAAMAIRRILAEHARARQSVKRGGEWKRADVELADVGIVTAGRDFMAIDQALERLAGFDPQKARIVELRFFAGLTTEQVAEALGSSVRTVAREWSLAKAWLSRELQEQEDDDDE